MELKLIPPAALLRPPTGSNRTFMELKLGKGRKNRNDYDVLIAPLWN